MDLASGNPRILRQLTRRHSRTLAVRTYGSVRGNWKSVNLSEGGSFVQSDTLLPIDTRLRIGFILPFPHSEVELVTGARVAWCNEGSASSLPKGMGLEFSGLDVPEQKLLQKYLELPPPIREIELEDFIEQPVLESREPTPIPAHEYPAVELDDGIADEEVVSVEVEEDIPVESGVLTPSVGSRLGSYRIQKEIGSGGMGSVYVAEHTALGRKVALKLLHPRFAQDKVIVERFFREARVVNQIRHENIVEITDFVANSGTPYFVMELLRGRSLSEELRGGAFEIGRALHVGVQLCGALQAAHQIGVIHRDLKPDNIVLVERDGRKDFVKLLDFGIAKLTNAASDMTQTQAGLILGTPGYISPEQINGKSGDHRSDLYSLGVILYALVTGKLPFRADTWTSLLLKHANETPPRPTAVNPSIPRRLDGVIMMCLEKRPEDRPKSAEDVAAHLWGVARSLPPEPWQAFLTPVDELHADLVAAVSARRKTSPQPRGTQPVRRRKVAPLFLGLGIFLAVLGAGIPWLVGSGDVPLKQSVQSAKRKAATVAQQPKKIVEQQAPAQDAEVKPQDAAEEPTEIQAEESAKPKKSRRRKRTKSAAMDTAFEMTVFNQLLRQKSYRQALDTGKALLAKDPRNAVVYRGMGIAYSALNESSQACESFRRYLRFAPNSPDRNHVEQLLVGCE